MVRSTFVFLVAVILSCTAVAQEHVVSSLQPQLLLNNTAEILPDLSLSVNANSSLLSGQNNFYRGTIALGLGDVAEIGVNSSDMFINAIGGDRPVLSWSLKLRILSRTANQPQIAVRIQNSVGWIHDALTLEDLQNNNRSLYTRGLWNSHYDLSLTTAQFLFSDEVYHFVGLHAGIGVQEVQTRNLWIIASPAPFIGNGFHAAEIKEQMVMNGFLSLTFPVSSRLLLISEVETLPSISPDMDAMNLTITRGYLASMALRYSLSELFACDAGVVVQSNPFTNDIVQARVALNTLVDFQ